MTLSSSPRLILEGLATPRGDGTADVLVAWLLDESPIGVESLPLRSLPGEPRVDLQLSMIADIDDATGEVTSYTKYGTLDVHLVDYPDAPLPAGLSLLAAVAPARSGGWSWSGISWTETSEIEATINGEGPPVVASAQPCEPIPYVENETRQLIELGNGLWLLIVVRDGTVYMMVYEQDPEDGCWRFGYAPQGPGGPGWGNLPDHTMAESIDQLQALWISQTPVGSIIEIPGGPLGDPP